MDRDSDGIITVGSDRLLMAVMTRDNATEQDGITLVESIARRVATALV